VNGRAVFALTCASCAVACSLFLDTGEFTAGDAPPPDAAADTSSADDATNPGDAVSSRGDAAGDVEAGPSPCPDGGFCDPFERTMPIGSWDGIEQSPGCNPVIDTVQAFEGKASLRTPLAFSNAEDCKGYVSRSFPGLPKKIRWSASVRVTAAAPREMHFLSFEVFPPGTHRAIYFDYRPTGLMIAEQEYGGAYYRAWPIGGLELDKWHVLRAEYDLDSKALRVEVDGVQRMNDVTDRTFAAGNEHVVTAGITYARQGDAFEMWFDDYRFEPTY
jgi:hypothetical protein